MVKYYFIKCMSHLYVHIYEILVGEPGKAVVNQILQVPHSNNMGINGELTDTVGCGQGDLTI